MQYYSNMLNRLFDTEKELREAEKIAEEKQKEVDRIKAERAEAAKKVEEAFKLADAQRENANQLLKEFVKKYGSFHTTITKPTTVPSIFEILNNFPFWF